MGSPLPAPEERRRPLLARPPVTAGPRDGAAPLGTDHGVRVVQEEPARLWMPQEAAAEQGDEARPVLQRGTDGGLQVPAVCSA